MRLSAADVARLPLPAALIDRDGSTLACTPEWRGAGLGTVAYRLPVTTLLVAVDAPDPATSELITELIELVRAAAREPGVDTARAQRLHVLAAGLALVAGSKQLASGTTDEVLERLNAVLAMISSYPVTVTRHHASLVPDADLLALALRQLVVNARRHDDATTVELAVDPGPAFTLTWEGSSPPGGISTARHVADRGRWGLGFVRLVCDALGAVYLAPYAPDGGTRISAVLGVDSTPRFLLPVAMVRDGIVESASPAWDEETHAPPGRALPQRWHTLATAASRTPGSVVTDPSGCARFDGDSLYVAIPPHGSAERARDLLLAMQHERDLLEVTPHLAIRIRGVVCIIGLLLGEPLPLVTPREFDAQYRLACEGLGVAPLSARFSGDRAPDAATVAVLTTRLDGDVRNVDGGIQVVASPARRHDPLLRRLADPDGIVRLH